MLPVQPVETPHVACPSGSPEAGVQSASLHHDFQGLNTSPIEGFPKEKSEELCE